ncbi:MAG: energy transducer TonB [Candidatus Eremiobacteraeota bacterium]|nr:energy transducer TonB [Candidatus Eremiobacteraeota bacterium]
MTSGPRERARSFLLYGFAISLAVHALVVPFVRQTPTVAAGDPVPRLLKHDRMPTPPPTPRPTPTPPPTAQPTPPPHDKPQTPQPQRPPIRIIAPHQDAHHGGTTENPNAHATGVPNGAPGAEGTAAPLAGAVPAATAAAPTPTPTPHPTPTPLSCARPNVPAATLRALEPETPPMAVQQGISGTVNVVVSLDAQSRIVATRIQSSPSALLNQPALAAARGSQFRTEVKNCEPVAADYLFSVEFTAQ